jgi:hypothetical protein
MIVEEAVSKHQNMIKELRGMPGVKEERWLDAFNVRYSLARHAYMYMP